MGNISTLKYTAILAVKSQSSEKENSGCAAAELLEFVVRSYIRRGQAVLPSPQECGLVSLLQYNYIFSWKVSHKDGGCRQLVHILLGGKSVTFPAHKKEACVGETGIYSLQKSEISV